MAHGNNIVANRKHYVVKANDLIRDTRYSLTTQQQKIVLFCISKIRKNDNPDKEYEISIDELCGACGLELDAGGFYYRTIKQDLVKLTSRLWVQMPDKTETTVSWISDATIIPLSGTVYVKFHPKMIPYLFDLNERYTQYRLEEVLVFHNKYAIRIYELLRSYITQTELDAGIEKEVMFTVDELREKLAIDAYKQWREFDRNVVKKAVDEINKYSDQMRVSYDTYKTGKKITKINFIIGFPSAVEKYVSRQESKKRLR